MKALITHWLATRKPLKIESLFNQLQDAHKQHISDLRVLIDQANGREAVLASMLQEALSQKKPETVKRAERVESKEQLPNVDHLNDVTTFDEDADAAELERQNRELASLIAEQEAQGISKP